MTESLKQRARALHHSIFTLDSHCDTPINLGKKGWNIGEKHPSGTLLGGDLDLPRMREGGLVASFFAVFVPQGPLTSEGHAGAKAQALAALDALDEMFQQHSDQCERALTAEDGFRIHRSGKRAIFLGMENGYPLGLDLSLLELYHQRGIRYITLCHGADNDICASSTASVDGAMVPRDSPDTGLSGFGIRVVKRMNQLGLLVDVSHISEKSVSDVLGVSTAPVIASHSGARALGEHPRNLTDAQLRAIQQNGGVVQVCAVSGFLKPSPIQHGTWQKLGELWQRAETHDAAKASGQKSALDAALEKEYQELLAQDSPFQATIRDLVDHIDHIVKLIGVDHVGIGTDFDGGGGLADCRDVTGLPGITEELLRRSYSERDIRKIWGGNALGLLAKAGGL